MAGIVDHAATRSFDSGRQGAPEVPAVDGLFVLSWDVFVSVGWADKELLTREYLLANLIP